MEHLQRVLHLGLLFAGLATRPEIGAQTRTRLRTKALDALANALGLIPQFTFAPTAAQELRDKLTVLEDAIAKIPD
jgi:hypothetical protein